MTTEMQRRKVHIQSKRFSRTILKYTISTKKHAFVESECALRHLTIDLGTKKWQSFAIAFNVKSPLV